MRKKQKVFYYKRFFINMIFSFVVIGLTVAGAEKFVGIENIVGLTIGVNKNVEAGVVIEEEELVPIFLHAISPEELQIQPGTDISVVVPEGKLNITKEDIINLSDVGYLKNNFYIVDKRTDIEVGDIKPEEFLAMDFKIDTSQTGPKVLIFHTHSQEMFADSDSSKGMEEGIYGVGEKLKEELETRYGIEVLHHNGRYDIVDGKSSILGAYERMEPDIRKILQENPSIEVVIDMHRDGVAETTHLVEEINGKQYAKIMFFNGMCKLYDNDVLKPIESLKNTYLNDNLGFSFNMQLTANSMYPNFTRRIYLNAYRYSLHMKAKSLLVEVGAQTNTKEEAHNSMELLADILAKVVLGE